MHGSPNREAEFAVGTGWDTEGRVSGEERQVCLPAYQMREQNARNSCPEFLSQGLVLFRCLIERDGRVAATAPQWQALDGLVQAGKEALSGPSWVCTPCLTTRQERVDLGWCGSLSAPPAATCSGGFFSACAGACCRHTQSLTPARRQRYSGLYVL